MVVIKRYSNRITIKGHAQYAPARQDVVCAGISTLAQTLIQSIEDLTVDTIEYDISKGYIEIKHGTLSADAQLLVESFFIGAEMIANEYPHHVQLSKP